MDAQYDLVWPSTWYKRGPQGATLRSGRRLQGKCPTDSGDKETQSAKAQGQPAWRTFGNSIERDSTSREHTLPLRAFLKGDGADRQTQSPLISLPAEIRHEIFKLALQTHCDRRKRYTKTQMWRTDLTGPRCVATALLRTCRLVYMETWSLPLLQTTLAIHYGEQPLVKTPWRKYEPTDKPQLQFCFFEAWQLLLLQHLELTFENYNREWRLVNSMLKTLSRARSEARHILELLTRNMGSWVKEFADNNLLLPKVGLGLKSMTVRLSRLGWQFWLGNEAHDTGSSTFYDIVHSSLDPRFFTRDFSLTVVLDGIDPHIDPVDLVAELAKSWRFLVGCRRSTGTKQLLRWDGQVHDHSWERQPAPMTHMSGLRDLASKFDVREYRFVPIYSRNDRIDVLRQLIW
jgi:hypothetical protein